MLCRTFALGSLCISKLSPMSPSILETAKSLPLPERIKLAQALWESIIQGRLRTGAYNPQTKELDRRLEAHEKNPDEVVAWETVKADLESKYGKS